MKESTSPRPLGEGRGEGLRHPGWLLAASVGVLGWTALVHANPPRFFLWATLYCAPWALLSWKAMGEVGRRRLTPRAPDLLWGIALAGVLYVGARGVLWALWRRSLAAAWVSHSLWDLLIVILLPAA